MLTRRLPLESVTDNPIFVRELRRRMRGKAMIFSTNAYIFFMCLVAACVLIFQVGVSSLSSAQQPKSPGSGLFRAIIIVQAVLVMLIAPTITSGMATAERERKTFDFLRVTTLSPFTFVMGGLLSTMLYALVVLVCALPLLSISFLYGGVAPSEIVLVFFLLVALALVLSSAGMLISSTRDKTKNAQGATMVFVILSGLVLFNVLGLDQITRFRDSLLDKVTLYQNVRVPVWLLFGIGVLAVSGLMLMVAARKLYSSEARPLNYRHTLAIFGISIVLLLGTAWGANQHQQWLVWTYFTLIFFFVAVTAHCLHRLEVGSDIWALKKRFPPLRWFDESIPFIVILALAWAAVSQLWMENSSLKLTESQAFPALQALGIAMALFLAISARCLAWRTGDRATAFKQALYLWMAIMVVLPMIFRLWFWEGSAARPVADALIYMSPYFQWGDFFDRATNIIAKPDGALEQAYWGATGFYAVGCIVFGALGIYYNRQHRRDIDYTYALTV